LIQPVIQHKDVSATLAFMLRALYRRGMAKPVGLHVSQANIECSKGIAVPLHSQRPVYSILNTDAKLNRAIMEACGPSGWINDLAIGLRLKTFVCSTKKRLGSGLM